MAEMQAYKCPNCGGQLVFDSHSQNMKCPYCDAEIDVETIKTLASEQQFDQKQDDWQEAPQIDDGTMANMNVYHCPSCGGEIITDQTTGATNCPFCDSPMVFLSQFSGDFKPDLVVPFKLDKESAKNGLKKHLTGKKLLPKSFLTEQIIDEIKGVYVPFWLFDAKADIQARYHATRVRTYQDSRYIYTETSHYAIRRHGQIGFENIPVDASTKVTEAMMESLEPYDLSAAVPFEAAYLSGFLADKYDIAMPESQTRAKERLSQTANTQMASTVIGYASVLQEDSHIQLFDGKSRYVLLPVWLLNTTYHQQKFTFAMNGQTGQFVGDLPCDNKAFWLGFVKYGSILALLIGAIAFMIGGM